MLGGTWQAVLPAHQGEALVPHCIPLTQGPSVHLYPAVSRPESYASTVATAARSCLR